ncbi:hypothetical protein K501DRAFT_334778 [Backusella circina FSU 941]|nr:hypothetical protein K501DRAFT_334778 [Backusella circina FSU 941]
MVKSTFLLATAASLFLASSVTAQAQPTAFPSIDPDALSSIADQASSIFESVMSNPAAVSSYVAQASSAVSLLPTEYQSSAASAIAAASSSLAAIEGHKSGASSSAYQPLGVVALIATVAGAAILM